MDTRLESFIKIAWAVGSEEKDSIKILKFSEED